MSHRLQQVLDADRLVEVAADVELLRDLGDIVVLWGWIAALALAAVGLWVGIRAMRKSS